MEITVKKISITRKVTSIFLSLTLILGLFTILIPTPANALSGINGTAPWTFNPSTSTLTIQAGTLNPRVSWNSNDFTGVISNQVQTLIIEPGVIAPANMNNFFRNWTSLNEIQGGYNLDTSNVTDMSLMFYSTSSLTTLDVSNWDTSNVTNMSWMFNWTPSLTTLDVSNWDTSSVTNMGSMFSWTSSLTTLDVSNWDTSNVTNMSWMFNSTSSLTTLDLSNWDTSNVADMDGMFHQASSLTTLDVTNWDMSSVLGTAWMFFGTPSLQELILGPNFSFNAPWNWTTAQLPGANSFNPNPSIYTGLWINLDTGWVGTAAELMTNFNGTSNTTGPGVYVWQRVDGIYPQLQRQVIFTDGFNDPSIIVSNMPTGGNYQLGTNFTIPSTIPQLQGYIFTGWRNLITNATLQPGDTLTITNNITLEAQWTVDETTVDPPINSTDPEVPNAGRNGLISLPNIYWFILIGATILSFFVGRKLLAKQK